MRQLLIFWLVTSVVYVSAQPVKDRIKNNDPSNYKELSAVHAGAGKMGFTGLIGRNDLAVNFLYLHAGVIQPKSGIGHHFHHKIEEMYVILSGEAEFTINGRTSKIKGPAIVPCKMGDSHGIYNASDQPIKWLNFAVSKVKGKGDAFDLGDDRVGASLDPVPQFVSARLERERLKENPDYPGKGVLHGRLLRPEVFTTDWDHVDYLVIPPGSSSGPRQLTGLEAVFYVLKGKGNLMINRERGAIKEDDAFFGKLGETMTLTNNGSDDLELLIIGVSPSKDKSLSTSVKPVAIALQMDFVVKKENAEAFERMYHSIYVPAMTVQKGYRSSRLLRLFPDSVAKEIEAEPTTHNYQIQISFDTEEDRRNWVASDQHQIAWPAASSLAETYKWRGYDVMGEDDQQ